VSEVRRLVLVWAVLFLVLLGVPSVATADESYYYCSLKPSNLWCDGRANGTFDGLNDWDFQEAWYPGAWDNTVTACQRIWRPSTGYVLGDSCGLNYTSEIYGDQWCTCFEANAKQISGGPHTIWGHALD
jgi:hypothetical protein